MVKNFFRWERVIIGHYFQMKRVLTEKRSKMLKISNTPNDIVVLLFMSLSAQNILHTNSLTYIYIIYLYTYNIPSIIS